VAGGSGGGGGGGGQGPTGPLVYMIFIARTSIFVLRKRRGRRGTNHNALFCNLHQRMQTCGSLYFEVDAHSPEDALATKSGNLPIWSSSWL
jgi:hypothetical protein